MVVCCAVNDKKNETQKEIDQRPTRRAQEVPGLGCVSRETRFSPSVETLQPGPQTEKCGFAPGQ